VEEEGISKCALGHAETITKDDHANARVRERNHWVLFSTCRGEKPPIAKKKDTGVNNMGKFLASFSYT